MVPTLGSLAGIELHDHQERNPTNQVCASVKTRQITGRHSSRSTRVLPSRANTKPAPGSLSAAHLDQRVRCECEHLAVQLTTEKLFSSKSPPPPENTQSHTGNPAGPDTAPTEDPICSVGAGAGERNLHPEKEKRKPPPARRSAGYQDGRQFPATALSRAIPVPLPPPSHTQAQGLLPRQPSSSQSGPARSRPAHDLGPAQPRAVLERQVFGGTPPHAAIFVDRHLS